MATDADLAKTELLLLHKYRVGLLQASCCVFIRSSTHYLVVWVFLFKNTITYSWVIDTDLQATSTLTRAWMKLI